ncbi:integrase arm-type DNA-binding domain-containing protein [Mesorhizobium atlanticum]
MPGRQGRLPAEKLDYFDTTVKGLVLRVSAGGQKTWLQRLYGPPNKRQWLKLGTYPETPLGTDKGALARRPRTLAQAWEEGGRPLWPPRRRTPPR